MSNSDAKKGGGVESLSVPMLTITFDPRTYKVSVTGNTPSLEFADAMLEMARKEINRTIDARRVERGIALAGPELLNQLAGKSS